MKSINPMYTMNENRHWHTNFVTYHEQYKYMAQYFHNTSLLWSYQLINPKLGVARGDALNAKSTKTANAPVNLAMSPSPRKITVPSPSYKLIA